MGSSPLAALALSLAVVGGSLALSSGCSSATPRASSAPLRVPEPGRTRRPPAAADWYWEAVETDTAAEPAVLELPVPEAAVARVEGATRLWDDLGAAGRDRLRKDGLVVIKPLGGELARLRMGAFYMDLQERRVPTLLTIDALHAATTLAIGRALAAVEEDELAPALDELVAKLGARLDATRRPEQELVEPLRVARGLVAVAAALSSGAAPSIDLVPVVAEEVARIEAHAGVETSALLRVPIDYGRFAVPSAAARPGAFRAAAWLGAAPLLLAGRTEPRGGRADIALARTHSRAAMLLARLVDRDVDLEVHDAYARVARLVTFVWGASDDVSLVELGDVAEASGMDLAKANVVSDVTRVDRIRHRVVALRPSQVYDGGGGATASGEAPASVRLLGGHAAPEARALSAMLSGELGRERSLPSTLDVAAFLGAPDVRAILREAGVDAHPAYAAALERALSLRPSEDAASRHGSVHGALLDVLLAWAEAKPAGARSLATDRARAESLLAAWTLSRHEGRPFARARPRPSAGPRELDVAGALLPVLVEPAPEPIARLVAAVRQASRGLGALGKLDPRGPAQAALTEIEDILGIALRVAARARADEPPSAEDATALGWVPARLAALEGDAPDANLALVTDVAADPRTSRALASAVSGIEPALVLIRDPSREDGKAVLAVGAHLMHAELVEGLSARTSDAAWLARVRGGTVPAAAPWTSTFRVTRGVRARP